MQMSLWWGHQPVFQSSPNPELRAVGSFTALTAFEMNVGEWASADRPHAIGLGKSMNLFSCLTRSELSHKWPVWVRHRAGITGLKHRPGPQLRNFSEPLRCYFLKENIKQLWTWPHGSTNLFEELRHWITSEENMNFPSHTSNSLWKISETGIASFFKFISFDVGFMDHGVEQML